MCPTTICPGASDANDGTSWGSAKQTLYAAWNALPAGPCAGGASLCGGTIYISTNSTFGGPVSGQGFRLLGHNDPNFASPPSGWLTEKPVSIICSGPSQWDSNQPQPACIITGESQTQPAFWISGTSDPIYFEGLKVVGGSGSVLAKDSNGVFENNASVNETTWRNCAFGIYNGISTNGPGLLVGPNSELNYFYGDVFDGNANATAASNARQALVFDPMSPSNINFGTAFISNALANSGASNSIRRELAGLAAR